MTESELIAYVLPAVGQVWRVGDDRWYLRDRLVNENGQVDFRAREVNGSRRATLTLEFLEDADGRYVQYISTPPLLRELP